MDAVVRHPAEAAIRHTMLSAPAEMLQAATVPALLSSRCRAL